MGRVTPKDNAINVRVKITAIHLFQSVNGNTVWERVKSAKNALPSLGNNRSFEADCQALVRHRLEQGASFLLGKVFTVIQIFTKWSLISLATYFLFVKSMILINN